MKFLNNWFKTKPEDKCSMCGHNVKRHTDSGQGTVFCWLCKYGVCQ